MSQETEVAARVTHQFSASPERVFDAWLDPAKVAQWFGPGLGPMVRIEIDPRVGGTFSFMQRRQGENGEEDIDHVGEYLEVDRPRRLVFTWKVPFYSEDSSRVIVEIAPRDAGCEVTVTHELTPEWAEYVSGAEDAWRKMLVAMGEGLG
jgi:uncharacterized protein YndB with AHSA1/START domain